MDASPRQAELLEILGRIQPASCAQIARAAGMKSSTVSVHLMQLKGKGLAESNGVMGTGNRWTSAHARNPGLYPLRRVNSVWDMARSMLGL